MLSLVPAKLPEDSAANAAAATAAGWSLDEDLWWHRPHRDGDIPIPPGNAHFGFDMLDAPSDNWRREAYVRSAAFALSYDKGIIIPSAANDQAAE